MTSVTRFAPSPTGYLHLGHAYSALFAKRAAQAAQGRFLLRIEDIDRSRCRPQFDAAILEDLSWLGVSWDGAVRRQSHHMDEYARTISRLRDLGLLYPCFCSRKDIAQAASAPHGPPANVYPGTCREMPADEASRRIEAGAPHSFRFNAHRAALGAGPLSFTDRGLGSIAVRADLSGDVVLGRRDAPASYHLCVVVDDAAQGVTLVTRGDDLLGATHVQRLIQAALGLPAPLYHHHAMLRNDKGERLSKRDGALSIRALREAGRKPSEVRRMAGFPD